MIREHILFVTWDGPQVSYLESLFVPIFTRLQRHGLRTSVLQFTWGDSTRAEAACAAAGIAYRRIDIWRRFGALGAVATALAGRSAVRRAIRDWNPTIVMPRSLFAGLAVLACGARNVPSMLFDADGLAADERLESGTGPAIYYALRGIERALVRRSCLTLVRTEAAARILADRAQVDRARFKEVANGRDPTAFKPATTSGRAEIRRALGVPDDATLLVYAGSAGEQYRLPEIATLVARLRSHILDVRLLILSGEQELARERMGEEAKQALVHSVKPSEVPAYISAGDAGLSLRTESLATSAVAPVKLGEYLLCGLPVIGTPRIGDTEDALAEGVMVDASSPVDQIAEWLAGKTAAPDITSAKARLIGLRRFSLERSVADYREAIAACRKRP